MQECAQNLDPITRLGIKKLFDKQWFDMSLFRELCKALKVRPSAEVENKLNILHCVHYNEMDTDVKQYLAALVGEAFDSPDFKLDFHDNGFVQIEAPKKGGNGLLGFMKKDD